jgi:hypothetical protein
MGNGAPLLLLIAAFTLGGLISAQEKDSLRASAAPRSLPSVNSLMVIVPYKHQGMWVFDDPAAGLNKEPFIAGIDILIDKATAHIPDAAQGFRAIFSAAPFPGATFTLQWRRKDSGGNWYYSPEFQQEGWLCPALFKYFSSAPREIYIKIEPRA